jgi:hypothetical protein
MVVEKAARPVYARVPRSGAAKLGEGGTEII